MELERQDRQAPRTLEDLIRRYKLPQLAANMEFQRDALIKIETELNNTITSLVINLEGVIGSQDEISSWFFFGTPTALVEPESAWTTTELKDAHIGDLYYDKGSGKAYQYQTDYTWLENTDIRLIQALALTNAKLVGAEHKIYFNRPSPPYLNGDWWIVENGDLWICQISRAEGYYTENDFIISSLYSPGTNNATANQLTILSGAVTTIKQSVNQILQTVTAHTDLLDSVTGELSVISSNYTSIDQTAASISFAVGIVNQAIETAKGEIKSITTEKGFKLDDDGLTISQTGETVNSNLDITGLRVKRNDIPVLRAVEEGVFAANITVDKYFKQGVMTQQPYNGGMGWFF